MKKTLLLFLLTATYFSSFAQSSTDPKISIGPEIGIPLGQANKVYNLVEGGSIKLEIPFSTSGLNLTITAGYDVFKVYSYLFYIEDGKYIPIEVGLKDYIPNSPVFIEGDLGLSINNNSNYSGPSDASCMRLLLGYRWLKMPWI